MKRHGFTLVELLTVIGIIAILASVSLPMIARARESGRGAACTSNLRQLGAAVALYASDYDGVYPFGLDPGSHAAGPTLFDEPYRSISITMPDLRYVMAPYVRPGPIWQCPSEHPFRFSSDTRTLFDRFGSSYSYYPYAAMLGLTDAYFLKPAESYLLGDMLFWHSGSYYGDGRLNVLFADYHARNVSWLLYLESGQEPP